MADDVAGVAPTPPRRSPRSNFGLIPRRDPRGGAGSRARVEIHALSCDFVVARVPAAPGEVVVRFVRFSPSQIRKIPTGNRSTTSARMGKQSERSGGGAQPARENLANFPKPAGGFHGG